MAIKPHYPVYLFMLLSFERKYKAFKYPEGGFEDCENSMFHFDMLNIIVNPEHEIFKHVQYYSKLRVCIFVRINLSKINS